MSGIEIVGWYLLIGVGVATYQLMILKRFGMLEHMLYKGHNDTNHEHRMAKMIVYVVIVAILWPVTMIGRS